MLKCGGIFLQWRAKPPFLVLSPLCSWLSALESTKWLQHLSVMLKAAVLVSNAVDREGRPVLVHCSDGWDRTPQIVALAKILLDPYYRTMEVGLCSAEVHVCSKAAFVLEPAWKGAGLHLEISLVVFVSCCGGC